MLELNYWFFVLLVNFLVLLFILNIILFKPLLKVFKEREDTVKGSLDSARQMTVKKETAIEDMKRDFASAGLKARAIFEELRAQGLERQKEAVLKAGQEGAGLTEEARQTLRQEAEKARKALRADVERFSDEIVRKLVKV
ncbi:MAG: ATP synthase F0 subunit B [Nitrospirae bacterium]|nr:ATP synthase F0 subunit B [Nitrospirota bacterium]